MAIAAALIYTASFASFIKRHTSLPFWDGFIYVQKTRNLAEKFHSASFTRRLNPALYLNEIQPERPPLLLATAAIILGPDPGNAAIAYVWLAVRVVVILLALYLLSREFGTTGFVPAAALVIFGSPLMCNFYRLYFMDEPFGAFGLLAFALVLIDDRRQTMGSALAAAAGILALFLIKPVAPALVFPWCVIRAARAFWRLRNRLSDLTPAVRPLILWATPYAVLLIVMLALLYASPYGPGVREQFKLGSSGYWHLSIDARAVLGLIALTLPPWLLLTLIATGFLSRGLEHRTVLIYTLGGLLWWLLFSFFLTYTVEDRLIGQAMPYVVVGVFLWTCQRPKAALALTLAAAFFFTYNAPAVQGHTHHSAKIQLLSPVPQYQQPVPEVGLIPFADQLAAAINAQTNTTVYGVFDEIYVEPNSLNLALHASTQARLLEVWAVPRRPQKFDLGKVFKRRWFITKTKRQNAGYTNTGLWTTINLLHSLITDPESPLHSSFSKVLEAPIHQPDLDDTLVLWSLPSSPPPSVLAEALRWVKPRLTNDPPAFTAAIEAQIKTLANSP